MIRMAVALVMVCGVVGLPSAGDDNERAELERDFQRVVGPFLQTYCLDCHGVEKPRAQFDVSPYTSLESVVRDLDHWELILKRLRADEMPPETAKERPDNQQRGRVIDWIDRLRHHVARRNAGDPGPIILRRLSNAEYTYTIRDLTGIDSLDPAREFPVDGAAGEGFTNTGGGQGMSPALVEKYLHAGKQVAQHMVLLPDGIRFSPYTTRPDQTSEVLARIQAFYRRFTEAGGGSAVNLQGIKFNTNQGGLLPLENYLKATVEEREALQSGEKTITAVAGERSLNARYLRTLWTALSRDPAKPPLPLIDELRRRWQGAEPRDVPKLMATIREAQQALWKFNPVGHIGRVGGPTAWMEPVSPLVSRQELRLKLPDSSEGKDAVFYLVVGDAGDGNEGDFLTWKNPRLEGAGRPPLPLRDAAGYAERLAKLRQEMLSKTATYLAAVADVQSEANVAEVTSRHRVDEGWLKVWLEYLAIEGSEPVEVRGHFREKMTNGGNYDFIQGWGVPATPSIVANSSDRQVRIPGIAKPHSVMVHPSPTLFAAVGWRSPVEGTVRVEALVADAHPECGNGVEWFLQHRTPAGTGTLGKGDFTTGGKTTVPPKTVSVRQGDLLSLIIGPREGQHACDLTEINLIISETDGAKRVWNLAKEVSGNILESNPHPDTHGHKDTWHFYQGEMAKIRADQTSLVRVPPGSLLDQWWTEKDAQKRRALAQRIQKLATSPTPSEVNSPDGMLVRQLQTLPVPRNHAELGKRIAPNERFGKHPLGHAVESADIVVQAPSVVEFRIPAELAQGREVVVTGKLESKHGQEGSVQLQLLGEKPKSLSWSLSTPILVAKESKTRERIESALEEFRNLFPAALCYARIVPVDEVVTLTLYYREDEHLKRLMLSDEEAAELDRLWEELYYVSQEPLKLVVAFEQISEFATQDRPDLVKAFAPMHKPITDRAKAFRQLLVKSESAHLRAILDLANRAWRRPLTKAERQDLRDLYQHLREDQLSHEEAIRLTLARVLTSPAFLYKLEQPAPGKEAKSVSDLELATRLSYFLWSSLPDPELRDLAEGGQLTDEEILRAQTRRMLDDERTRRLAIQFACQWLHVRDFDQNDDKNEKLYPEFAKLRADMYQETVRFFEHMFRHDGSILDMIDADHTFLNESLAKHYGIDGVTGPGWRQVNGVRARGRGGVLGMATVLASQSGASRTSPILRGNWIYETLLGERLPRPPANVPQLPETVPSGLTARELIERHSSVAACARCHAKIDPYGFALERYDAIGRLRPRKVDTQTTLIDGKMIEGLDGLRDYLMKDRREDVVRQFCRKLLGYALGREVQLSDEPLLEEMRAKLEANDYRFRVAVEAIVTSPQFRNIRGQDMTED